MRTVEKVFYCALFASISIAIGVGGGKIAYAISLIPVAGLEIFFIYEWIAKRIRTRRNRHKIVIRFDVSELNMAADKFAKAIKEMASRMGGAE